MFAVKPFNFNSKLLADVIKASFRRVMFLSQLFRAATYTYVNRITDFNDYKIYANEDYDGKNLKPDAVFNSDLITKNWDEMLRFVATIKTGYTPASVIIPKLWNRFEDPMFIGLRELGRTCQTIFILKYIDTVELRQTIEHHLKKAALHAGLSRFIQKPPRKSEFIPHADREFNDACAGLLKNCILAWNFAYLSKLEQDTLDMEEILRYGYIIPHGSDGIYSHSFDQCCRGGHNRNNFAVCFFRLGANWTVICGRCYPYL